MRIQEIIQKNRTSIVNALKHGVHVAAGLALMRLSGLLVSIVIAKTAGAETLGEFTFFLTIYVLTSEVFYSFDLSYLREAGVASGPADQRQYLRWAMAAKLVVASLVALILIALSDHISGYYGKKNIGNIVVWAVIAGSLNALYMSLVTLYQKMKRFGVVGALQPVPNVVILVTISVVALLGLLNSIEIVTDIYLIVCGILGLSAFSVVTLRARKRADDSSHRLLVLKGYLVVIGTLLLAKAISLISIRLDVFFLGRLLSYEELGLYGVALRISVLVSAITAITGTIILPRAAEAMKHAAKFRRYLGLSGLYVGLQTFAAAIFLLFIEPIITLTFGSAYVGAALVTGILIVQALFTAFGIPFQALMQCGMRPYMSVLIACLRLLISIPLLVYSVPRYGMTGAAVTVASVALVISVMQFSMVWMGRPKPE